MSKLKLSTSIAWPVVILIIAIAAFYFKPWQQKAAETISVSAQGKTQVTPNIAIISASVESKNPNLDLARKENEEKVEKNISQLKNLGVDEKDIKTTNIQAPPGGPEIQIYPAPRRYSVFSATLEIKIQNFEIVDEVIEILTKNGSINLYGPNLTLSTEAQETAKSKARQNAVESARKKAEELAKLSQRKLGKISSITEAGEVIFPQPLVTTSELDLKQTASQIQPGQSEVTVNIKVDFELK